GTVTDPISNRRGAIISPFDGRIIGMAINQVVMPGFAAFHLGRESSRTGVSEPGESALATESVADTAVLEDVDPHEDAVVPIADAEAEPAPLHDESPIIEMEPDDHSE